MALSLRAAKLKFSQTMISAAGEKSAKAKYKEKQRALLKVWVIYSRNLATLQLYANRLNYCWWFVIPIKTIQTIETGFLNIEIANREE